MLNVGHAVEKEVETSLNKWVSEDRDILLAQHLQDRIITLDNVVPFPFSKAHCVPSSWLCRTDGHRIPSRFRRNCLAKMLFFDMVQLVDFRILYVEEAMKSTFGFENEACYCEEQKAEFECDLVEVSRRDSIWTRRMNRKSRSPTACVKSLHFPYARTPFKSASTTYGSAYCFSSACLIGWKKTQKSTMQHLHLLND